VKHQQDSNENQQSQSNWRCTSKSKVF